MPVGKGRLDVHLVKFGLVDTREQAQEAIAAKHVLVNGSIALKAAQQVRTTDAIRLLEDKRYVSRAGFKLERALESFRVEVNGRHCLDVGLSTGGFSQCLLEKGAHCVTGVDVGTSQVHEKIAKNPKMTVYEQTDIRDFAQSYRGDRYELVVCDVSFISVTSIVLSLETLLQSRFGQLLVLIKPQFELGRVEVSKGKGVIRSVGLWREALDRVTVRFQEQGLILRQLAPALPKGASGNQEFVALFENLEAVSDDKAEDREVLIESALGELGDIN